jgi:FAD/FMN-containing dehydrogenase
MIFWPMASNPSFRAPRSPLVLTGGSELHARDMTATFAADVTLDDAQRQLAAVGQWLPIDGSPRSTLGELVNHNSTGPLRLGFGAWRDLLLGAQFTNGRGELITAGGRVMKNVAGYDLTKFIIGSGGIFGRIVTITVRTWLRPAAALIARHAPDVRILPTPLKPQWALLTRDALWLGYLGDEPTLAYYRIGIGQSEPLEWRERSVADDIADRSARWQAAGTIAFRAAVPPMQIGEFVASLETTGWIADAAFGIVLGGVEEETVQARTDDDPVARVSNPCERRGSETEPSIAGTQSHSHGLETRATIGPAAQAPSAHPDLTRRIRAAAEAVGGAVRFARTDGSGRAHLLDVSTNPIERQIIERLKATFDPDGVLNPLPWQSR